MRILRMHYIFKIQESLLYNRRICLQGGSSFSSLYRQETSIHLPRKRELNERQKEGIKSECLPVRGSFIASNIVERGRRNCFLKTNTLRFFAPSLFPSLVSWNEIYICFLWPCVCVCLPTEQY